MWQWTRATPRQALAGACCALACLQARLHAAGQCAAGYAVMPPKSRATMLLPLPVLPMLPVLLSIIMLTPSLVWLSPLACRAPGCSS